VVVSRDRARLGAAHGGYVNFHGAPGVNDTNTDRAAWSSADGIRVRQKRGYATETGDRAHGMATDAHGIRHFISSTTPENKVAPCPREAGLRPRQFIEAK